MTESASEQALIDEIIDYYGEGTTLDWHEDSPNDLTVTDPAGHKRQETAAMPSRAAALAEVVARFARQTGA